MVWFDLFFVWREADAVENPFLDVAEARDLVPAFALVGVGHSVFVDVESGVLFTGVVEEVELAVFVPLDVFDFGLLDLAEEVRDFDFVELTFGFLFGEGVVVNEVFGDGEGFGRRHEMNSVMMSEMMTMMRVRSSTSSRL